MLSNVAVHEALRPTDYAGKVPSHLRRKGSHGVRRERSISNGPGGRKTPTVVAGDKDYQNGGGALTDRGARAKTHLAAIAKQVSGSNYHAYKIDETPEESKSAASLTQSRAICSSVAKPPEVKDRPTRWESWATLRQKWPRTTVNRLRKQERAP